MDFTPGQISYKERLLSLNMLPLAYDREMKEILFFYKAIHGYIDRDVSYYATFFIIWLAP